MSQADTRSTRALSLRHIPVVPALIAEGWRSGSLTESGDAPATPAASVKGTAVVGAQPLCDAEVRLLRAILSHPGRSSSEYPRLAGVSTRRAVAMRERLVAAGYLRAHSVSRAGTGRDAIVLEVTDAGLAVLQRIDGEPQAHPREAVRSEEGSA